MRYFNLSILGFAAVSMASAGQIEVGQIIGGQNAGLTASYVTGATACVGGGTCINTSTSAGGLNNGVGLNSTGFTEASYDTTLWAKAPLTSPQPFTGYTSAGPISPGDTMADPSGTTFAMIADTTGTDNVWDAASSSSVTIPIGVFGVTQAWTMIDDRWGAIGPDTTVTFNFGTSSNVVTTSVAVQLTGNKEIRGAVDCGTTNTNCSGYTQSLATGPTMVNGVAVTATQMFSASYSYPSTGGHGQFASSSGNLVLDDQEFNFSNYVFGGSNALTGLLAANAYLVDIVVTDSNNVNGGLNGNQTALSAITLATPEPSTWLMLGTGMGMLGFARRRRK